MKRKLSASMDMRYGTRRLKAGEIFEASGQHARLLVGMKRAAYVDEGRERATVPAIPESLQTRAMVPATVAEPVDEMKALRAEYREKIGRPPFNGWDADTLKQKIAEAVAEE